MSSTLSNLTSASALDGTELVYVDQTSNDRKTTTQDIADLGTSQDNMTDGTTNKNYTATEKTKLAGIETGADVTDATNVDAAGATMNTDTDVSGNSWVLDEDDMASDSATKLPTQQSVKAFVVNGRREKLTANRTYYLATTGSDSNDGLSSGAAFATIQYALDVVAALDLSVYSVTINVAAGTYTSGLDLQAAWVGGSSVNLVGDQTTPSNVVVNVTGNSFRVRNGKTLTVKGFKVISTVSNFTAIAGSQIILDKIEFGGGSNAIVASGKSSFTANGTFTVSASYTTFISLDQESVGDIFGSSWTLTGTPAWSVAFLYVTGLSYVLASGSATFTGAATGRRYNLSLNSAINTAGGGASYLPGDTAGSTATGGQYI